MPCNTTLRDLDPLPTYQVDGNQLCDLGHATQAILFYRGLRAMAQSEQSLDIGI